MRRVESLGADGAQLIQDDRYFKLGMDSVLLSWFAQLPQSGRVCELGCGAGGLTVLLALKNTRVRIDAVEILPGPADLARENIQLNGLGGRVEVQTTDLRLLRGGDYDCVVTNPPYKKVRSGAPRAGEDIKSASEEVHGTISDLCGAAARLLRWGGDFFCVYRVDRLCDLTCALRESALEPKLLQFVARDADCSPTLVLLAAKRGAAASLTIRPTLFTHSPDGGMSPAMRQIYQITGFDNTEQGARLTGE